MIKNGRKILTFKIFSEQKMINTNASVAIGGLVKKRNQDESKEKTTKMLGMTNNSWRCEDSFVVRYKNLCHVG